MTRLTKINIPRPPHRTATLGRFSPTLLAHAIAPHPTATPKQWQEPNHPDRWQNI